MIQTSNLERNNIGFQEAVNEYFGFLSSEYGFNLVHSDLYKVKYESKNAYVNIYHERLSYELYFEVGLSPDNNKNKLWADSKDFIDTDKGKTFFQASSKESVITEVKTLAEVLREHGKDALLGLSDFFNNIVNNRERHQNEALKKEQLRLVDPKVNDALKRKDYSLVVEVYSGFEEYLNSLQAKKLEFAKKKLHDN